MSWTGKRVLVTGAGGFIGSHLVERLVELGANTRALVRYTSSGTWGWLDESPCKAEVEVIAGDLRDSHGMRRTMAGVDRVFHLGALIAIPYSYHAPESYVQTNIEGTLNVLQCAREANVERVIHTSTSEVYGTAQYVPIDEKHPLVGQSPYSATKIAADKLAESFHLSFGTPVVTVRPFNTYGPRQSARAVIPTIITQCLTGDTVRLGNLAPTRDLTFVSDTVEGFVCAAEAGQAALGKTVNLGAGSDISIGDLAFKIAGLTGKAVSVQSDDQRMRPGGSEVERLLSDNRLARELIGWTPQVTLEAGLRLTIEWVERNLSRFRPDTYQL
ncbi:MAG: NAD-dependent dehydratase [Betaproteobacteria bacterium]|nr:NAD-dependent dehydratase [Betaproteobacteria bacterium]